MNESQISNSKFRLNGWAKFIPIYAVLLGFLVTGLIWGGTTNEKIKTLEREAASIAELKTSVAVIQVEIQSMKESLKRIEENQKIAERLERIESRLAKAK